MRAIKSGIALLAILSATVFSGLIGPAAAQAVIASQNAQIASSARNITFAFNNTPLSVALDELAQRSGTKITYSGDVVSGKRVSARGTNVDLKNALHRLWHHGYPR